MNEEQVYCIYGQHFVDISEAIYLGTSRGPDLMEVDEYICEECQDEIDCFDDEF